MLKKICIITTTLGHGGSQKVAYHLLNNLNIKKFQLSFITIHKDEGEYLANLRKGITHISLKRDRVRYSIIDLYKALRNINPDIVIVFSFELMIIIGICLCPLFKHVYFITRQNNIISKQNFGWLKKIFFKKALKNFDKLIVQSNDMKEDLLRYITIDKEKIIEINNPVNEDEIEKFSKENINIEFDNKNKNLLCVGKLAKQKGFDLIINIMKEFENTNIKLYIIGDGKERDNLIKLINEKKLEKTVFLLGRRINPYIYMKKADLFILSSRYEGFPNVLIEAGACGTYSICNNSIGGINEIIEQNLNGNLVDFNDRKLTSNLIKSKLENFHDSNKIKNYILKKYSLNIILKQYEKLFLIKTSDNKGD